MEWIRVEKDSVKKQPYPEMYKPHAHRRWEIYYLKSGERKYFIEDKVYPIKPGDFALISTYALHKTNGRDYERIILYFDYEELPEALRPFMDKSLARVVMRTPTKYRRFVEELLERMAEEYKENGPNSKLLAEYFHALVLELSRFSESVPVAETAEDDPIIRVVKYINENYTEDISVEALAGMVYLSRAHFCRRFKKVTGFSPLEYIHSVRLKAAETLLETTEKSITEIAILSGFPGGNYFGDFFKKYRGMSPREWRKMFRK